MLLSAEAHLQSEVLREKARSSGLEVQIRALSLELTHAREHAGVLLWLRPVCTCNSDCQVVVATNLLQLWMCLVCISHACFVARLPAVVDSECRPGMCLPQLDVSHTGCGLMQAY